MHRSAWLPLRGRLLMCAYGRGRWSALPSRLPSESDDLNVRHSVVIGILSHNRNLVSDRGGREHAGTEEHQWDSDPKEPKASDRPPFTLSNTSPKIHSGLSPTSSAVQATGTFEPRIANAWQNAYRS